MATIDTLKSTLKNHKPIAIACLAIMVAVIGIIAYSQGAFAGDPDITEAKAMAIAEDHMGGTALSVELEREGRSLIYEVVIENDDGLWEVEVDAKDGSIIEVERDDGDEEDDDDDDDD